jgi:hypothetical protein
MDIAKRNAASISRLKANTRLVVSERIPDYMITSGSVYVSADNGRGEGCLTVD